MIDPRELARTFRVDDGTSFRLKHHDPKTTLGITKEHAEGELARGVDRLSDLQSKLYAQNSWAVLAIFQAMDAAGKDGVIKHVMSGVNPQGCQVFSFKTPSVEELDHDYLWRATRCLPERGRIGIFNRSYYEELLVVRVHPKLLEAQRLPVAVVGKHLWKQRAEDIRAYERYLARNGVVLLKFFLNISKEEQRQRFLARLEEPAKNWKFSSADARERDHWNAYMKAYEFVIRQTAAGCAPWYVVPADHKWFCRLVTAAALIERLEGLRLDYPKIDRGKKRELDTVRRALESER
jgi:PPK2 family polyphosphate:nucleotide phosphotransferase